MRRFYAPLGLALVCLGSSVGCDTRSKTVIHTPPPAPTSSTVIIQGPSVPVALGQTVTPAVSTQAPAAATPTPAVPPAVPVVAQAPATPPAATPLDPSAPVAIPVAPPLPGPVADVVQLTRGGLDEGVVSEYITHIREPFALGAAQIVYLNDLGVSSNIIHRLMSHAAAIRPGSPTATAAPAQPTASAPAIPTAGIPEAAPGVVSGSPIAPPVEGTPPPAPGVTTTVVAAPAAPTVVNQQVFYQSLSPYGSWVEVPNYGWCWRPSVAVANPTWQPYCDGGSWLWTDAGWYWNSTYTWGWAPYHYGRWHQHQRFGWVWYPGYDWAPAWVAWRSSTTYCGWAPLPPECRWNASVGFSWVNGNSAVSIGFGIGATAWYATTWDRFCDPHLYHHRLPRQRVEQFVQESKVQVSGHQNVNIRGNNNTVIINNGISRDEVQRHSREEIRRTELRDVNSPAAAHSFAASRPNPSGGRPAEVAVYRPSVPVHDARPPESVLKRPEISRLAPPTASGGNPDRIGITPPNSRPLVVPSGGGSLNPSRPSGIPSSGLAPSTTPNRPAPAATPVPTERFTQTVPQATRPGVGTPSAAAPKISGGPATPPVTSVTPSRPPESRTTPVPRTESGAPSPTVTPNPTLAPNPGSSARFPAGSPAFGARPIPTTAPGSPTQPSAGAPSASVPAAPPTPRTIVIPEARVPSRPSSVQQTPSSTPATPTAPSAPPSAPAISRQEAFRPAPAPAVTLPPSAIQSRPAPAAPAPAPIQFAPAPSAAPSPRPAPSPIPSAGGPPPAPAFQPSARPAPSAAPAPAPVQSGRPGPRNPAER